MTGDPGLQPQRTRLAWRRTLLAFTAVAALLVRLALTGPRGGALLAGATALIWLGVLLADWHRTTGAGVRRVRRWSLPLTALAAAGLSLLGVLVVLHRPG